jgi:hypothetical protein
MSFIYRFFMFIFDILKYPFSNPTYNVNFGQFYFESYILSANAIDFIEY